MCLLSLRKSNGNYGFRAAQTRTCANGRISAYAPFAASSYILTLRSTPRIITFASNFRTCFFKARPQDTKEGF